MAQGHQMPLKPGVWLKRRIVKVTYPSEGMGPSIQDGPGPFPSTDEGNFPDPEQIQVMIIRLKEKLRLIQEKLHGGPVGGFDQLEPIESNINMLKALAPGQTKTAQNEIELVEGQTDVGHHMLKPEAIGVAYNLTSQLYVESSIIVEGVVNDNAKWFQVNFLIPTEDSKKPDIGFLFGPMFAKKAYTALNTRIKGTWGKEKDSGEETFPFRQGQPFHLEFYITKSMFWVAVDGQHYVTFEYRESLKSISKIQIIGEITLTDIHFQNIYMYPSPPWQTKPVKRGQTDVERPMLKPEAINVVYKLMSQLYAQSSIIVEGWVNDDARSFEVNFLIGTTEDYASKMKDFYGEHSLDAIYAEMQPEIGFHFNPMFREKSYTALKNRMKGIWDEEKHPFETNPDMERFPFFKGQPFCIEFYIIESEFKVAVNGQHYLSYKHRVPYKDISKIQILGHITLDNVIFQTSPEYPSPLSQGVWICEEDYNKEEHGEILDSTKNQSTLGKAVGNVAEVKWVPGQAWVVPANSVFGGYEEALYVGRAKHKGSVTPCKIITHQGTCYLPWGGAEHNKHEYEVLTGRSLHWVPAARGQIPPNAVVGGTSETGETLYIGRVYHKGIATIGKVYPSYKECFVSYGGLEFSYPEYQILVQQ